MKITIKEIAKMADVSIGTVSRIINNSGEGYSEETRDRVLQVIKENNYVPNEVARGLITKRTKTLGLILSDITNPFFPFIVRGAEDEANKRKYSLILCNSDNNTKKEIEYIQLLKQKYVDGILCCTNPFKNNKKLEESLGSNIPVVITDNFEKNHDGYGVFVDNEIGGYIATKHLIELGHKKIACITGPSNSTSSIQRMNGYKRALKDEGITFDIDLIVEGNYKIESGIAGVQSLKDSSYTSIFAFNDLMAYGVYKEAANRGLKIPEDISVVGFDDINISQLVSPELTTIFQPAYEIGRKAAELLINRIEGTFIEKNIIMFEPELIIRKSTKMIGG